MGDPDHRAIGRQHGQRGVEPGGGVRVQVGGGLVQQQQRRVAQERAGQRELLALAGGQPQPALSDFGVVARGQILDDPFAPAARAAAAMASRLAAGSPSAMFAATDASNRCGSCGIQAIWRRQSSSGTRASSTSPTSIRPLVGSVKRSNRASSELFPAPLGPIKVIWSPGLIVMFTPDRASRPRPG